MDLKDIACDPELEAGGARVRLDDVTTIVVARYGNTAFRKMRNRLVEPYQKKSGREDMSTEEADDVLSKCMAKHILVGWEGLMINGEDIPYSEKAAYSILSDPRFREFKSRVMEEANSLENYRLERLDDDLGNFGRPSSTARAGKKTSKKRTRQ